MSRVWACVPGQRPRWRKYPPRGPPGPCGAFVGRIPVRQFYQGPLRLQVSDFQAGERPGAVNGTRAILHRPATPVVSRDSGIFVEKMVRCRFWGSDSRIRCRESLKRRISGGIYGAADRRREEGRHLSSKTRSQRKRRSSGAFSFGSSPPL